MSMTMNSSVGSSPLIALRRNWMWWAAIFLVLLLPHIFPSPLAIAIMNQMGIVIIFSVAYNMLLGQSGMLSFGHAVYFGLGGYFVTHFMNWAADGALPVPIPVAPLIGGLAGLTFGIIFGSFSTTRAGTVFAMISLGIGELIAASSLIFVSFSGGEEGVTVDRTEMMEFFGFDFAREIEVYYVIGFWMMLTVGLMYLFSRTPVGRMANAVRDNPERAEFVGYSQKKVRFISFMASGFFAGVAGGLFTVNYEIVTEETVNLATSGTVLLMAYIGGIGFFAGPVIGAIVFTLLQTLLSNYTEIWALYVGLVFVATVMWAPTGLTGILMMHGPVIRAGRFGRLLVPYVKIGLPVIVTGLGFIGLLELLHFTSEAVGEVETNLFGLTVDVSSMLPWGVLGLMAAGGSWLARRAAPGLVAAWEDANDMSSGGGAQ